MRFEVIGEITDVAVIARGPGVRLLYLYHRSHFVFVNFPAAVRRKLRAPENAASQKPDHGTVLGRKTEAACFWWHHGGAA